MHRQTQLNTHILSMKDLNKEDVECLTVKNKQHVKDFQKMNCVNAKFTV